VKLRLVRFLFSDHGTFGTLEWTGAESRAGLVLFTCEEEWRDNAPSISCIPSSEYEMVRVVSPRFGETYEIVGVPGRDAILFHAGNTEEDTRGCVLTGMALGVVRVALDEERGVAAKKLAVLRSKAAHEQFMKLMGGVARATITIEEQRG
jgi:hypothetical protein